MNTIEKINESNASELNIPEEKLNDLSDMPESVAKDIQEEASCPGNLKINKDSSWFEELSVDNIMHFDEIPDFITKSECRYPIVVRQDGSLWCIDNWELIAVAKKKGVQAIESLVIEPANPSVIDTALRKVESRIRTEGGSASYCEILIAVQSLQAILLSSDENIVQFAHGGNRYRLDENEKESDNIKNLLANRLNKSTSTVSRYLRDVRYLSEDALNELHDLKATKELFDKISYSRKNFLNSLNVADFEIEKIQSVSEFVLDKMKQAIERKKGKKADESAISKDAESHEPDTIKTEDETTPADSDEDVKIEPGPYSNKRHRGLLNDLRLHFEGLTQAIQSMFDSLESDEYKTENLNTDLELLERFRTKLGEVINEIKKIRTTE